MKLGKNSLILIELNSKSSINFFKLQFDLSCKNTRQTLGAMFMRTNYVTLKYVTDAWGTDNNGFKLVITAVKDPSEYTFSLL